MSYHYILIKHYKRGASYDTGQPRMCLRCAVNGGRKNRAIVTAIRIDDTTKRRFPVEYCGDHIPEDLQ